MPFVVWHQDQFLSGQGVDGATIWEVPKAMVALVSMAYYAALSKWITGEQRHHDFTTNMFTEAYKCHISTLDKIEGKHLTSYQNIMAEIYQFAVISSTATAQPPLTAPLIDLTVLED
ncbi:hypothetical protein V8E53_006133 [Lactarius tabidus]